MWAVQRDTNRSEKMKLPKATNLGTMWPDHLTLARRNDATPSHCASPQSKHQVECGLLLDVIVRKGPAILELLPCKDQTLLVWRDALFILDLRLDVVNRVAGLDVQGDGLTREGLDEDLHASSETKHQVESGFLLDVIVRKGPAVLELLPCEDQALLIRRNAFFILDLRLHVVNCVAGLDVQGDGLARECLDEDLHASSEAKHQMESGFLLDVIVRKGPAILE